MKISRLEGAALILTALFLAFTAGWMLRGSGDAPAILGKGCVYGTYIHGIFDAPGIAEALLGALCRKKGLSPETLAAFDPAAYKERQYDLLAQAVRDNLDMELVHRILDRTV